MRKIDRLERLVKSHELYWEGRDTPLTDAEYDQEMKWLAENYPKHYLLNKVGGSAVTGEQVSHKQPMLSLNKAYSYEEVKTFIQKYARSDNEYFTLQAKFDGLAGKLENGVFSTRGNGFIGENISCKIKDTVLIEGACRTDLDIVKSDTPILGEIICSKYQFKQFGQGYKTPRNFVVGMVSKKGPMIPGFQLHFVRYDKSPSMMLRAGSFDEKTWDRAKAFFDEIEDYTRDGIVIKISDEEYAASLGNTAHHPRGALAYKFEQQRAQARLLQVIWQAGKNSLTPVAVFSPVEIGGVTITRATLHNYDFVRTLSLKIGDILEIERAGDVIPHIISARRSEHSSERVVLKHCPFCGTHVKCSKVEVYCPNTECCGRSIAELSASIREADIKNLGPSNLQKITRQNKIRYFYELFDLTMSDISRCGIGEKTSKVIFQEIQKARSMTPETFLACLCIQDMGKTTWKTVLSFRTLESILENSSKRLYDKVPCVGAITVRKIIQGLTLKKHQIEELRKRVDIKTARAKADNGTICFTGKMPEKRSYYEELAKQNGFEPVDSVNKELTLLVCDSLDSNSSKLLKAKKAKIEILTLQEWLKGIEK